MGDALPLTDGHHAVERLLPWYATAQLDPSDTAIVAAHLAICAECSATLLVERRLKRAVASLSPRTGVDWAALQARLNATPRQSVVPGRRDGRAAWRRPSRIGRAFAAPVAAAAAAVLAVTLILPGKPAPYRTLSGPIAAAVPTGNLIVMFRPDTTEERLRDVLRASGARMVDGPTTSNAYVLLVPGDRRVAALAQLRAQTAITLAEPVDAAPTP